MEHIIEHFQAWYLLYVAKCLKLETLHSSEGGCLRDYYLSQ